MNILNLSLDNKILQEDSALRKRLEDYAMLVDKYTVVVPAVDLKSNVEITVNDRLSIIGIASKSKAMALWNIYKYLGAYLKKEKVDVITVQDQYYLAFIALRLAKMYKVGIEIQNHGFEKFSGLRKAIFKYVIKRADAVRTVSERLRKKMIEEFSVEENKVMVVPIYVETMNRKPIQKVQKLNVDNFFFLTVGRLVPVKNIGMQIDAMAEVVKHFPKVELWVVGEGPLKDDFKSKIEELKLSDNVKLLGWHQDISNFYENADVFMLTSHAEAWPLSVIEAASYGLPMIITDTGSAGEFIINGENGIVIPVDDRKALADSMINMVVNDHLRDQLSANVLESLKKLPSKEEILGKYLDGWKKAMYNPNTTN